MESIDTEKIKSLRCDVQINNIPTKAIIDTGAATNVITQTMLEDLGYEIQTKSNATFIIANGERKASLGKSKIEIEMQDWIIPIIAEVIDSRKKELLLGASFLARTKGNINFDNRKMQLTINNNRIDIPIYYTQQTETELEEEYSDEYDEDNDLYEEFDKEFEIKTTLELENDNQKN